MLTAPPLNLTVINRVPVIEQITIEDDASDQLYSARKGEYWSDSEEMSGSYRHIIVSASDTDGDELTYTWKITNKGNDVTNTPNLLTIFSHLPNKAAFEGRFTLGIHEITVIATDTDGAESSPMKLELTVVEAKAVITEPRAAILLDTPATWSAQDSTGIGDFTYKWTIEESPEGAAALSNDSNEVLNYRPNKNGRYHLKLTVTATNNADFISKSSNYRAERQKTSSADSFFVIGEPIKKPIVSGIISIDPSGLRKSQDKQYLMVQALSPYGDELSAEWLVDDGDCSLINDNEKYSNFFAPLTVSGDAGSSCQVSVVVSSPYPDNTTAITQSFTIQPAIDEVHFFAYYNDDTSWRITLPAQTASYTVPAQYHHYYVKDKRKIKTTATANSLQLPAGWNCAPDCSNPIDFDDTEEQTIILSKEGINITLTLLANNNPARAVLSKQDLRASLSMPNFVRIS